MLGGYTQGDFHHPAISETDGEYESLDNFEEKFRGIVSMATLDRDYIVMINWKKLEEDIANGKYEE